jgi:hypothetical protein
MKFAPEYDFLTHYIGETFQIGGVVSDGQDRATGQGR